MTSQLETIYNTLAAIGVSDGEQNIIAPSLTNVVPVITQTPQRVISPLSEADRAQRHTRLSFGGQIAWTWQLTDVCLFAKEGQGSGFEYYYPRLTRYMANYVSAVLVDNRQLLGARGAAEIVNATLEATLYNFPARSDDWWFAVVAELEIREIIA